MTNSSLKKASSVYLTLFLCFCIAILEGFDIQSIGVAAPSIQAEFNLTKGQLGWIFSAATLGMFPGAIVAGRLSDKIGRKKILIFSVAIFGVMSLLTAFTTGFNSLVLIRFLTGVGMGGALPLIIAMSSESVSERWSATAVSIMYAGVPIGAAITALAAGMFTEVGQWKNIFYLGGLAPILILPLLALFLKETYTKRQATKEIENNDFKFVLFGEGRLASTLQIWLSFLGTLIVLYFILNWLPVLMQSNGLSMKNVSNIQVSYQVGALLGVLSLGWLLSRIKIRTVVIMIYVGILVGLSALAISKSLTGLMLSAALSGFFLTGGQSALYALAAKVYQKSMRGTGVGVAVAMGRIGSFIGPLLAGLIFSYNSSSSFVIGSSIPVIIIAAIAAIMLTNNISRRENLDKSMLGKNATTNTINKPALVND
ncbi:MULTISPECIES: 3-(3-hydroxy-phenyl)propionate transporter MhpT [Psychrobacter]|uniref:3-(3-hydroxy-phenyl)propionate transporter MhpT n=1 Tax=Psychrobacter TaxID=497 RepID=UPI000ED5EB52|nr:MULTISPECIES: 3-(3-hydroxy-phenyl)propionate transporter MhpT [Psychrobacter]HCT72816.1 3-(3-hydroxy-phenyl)propionate transporter MhpT [Psychrobacter sp.]